MTTLVSSAIPGTRVLRHARMPSTGETVNGESFTIPEGQWSMAIHCPALVGSATLNIQSISPYDQTWRQVSVFDLTGVSAVQPLDSIPSDGVTILPTSAVGGGTYRFVASQDQSSVPTFVTVVFGGQK